jgi:predicted permease
VGTRRLHGAFISAELALTVVLLVSAGILGRTLLRLSALDPGFRLRGVVAARIAWNSSAVSDPGRVRASWRDLLERVRRVPGVDSAAAVDTVPMRNGINELPYAVAPNLPSASQTPALATGTTPDYLHVMGIPLLHGRFFTDQDKLGSEPVVVIDSVMAQKAFPNQDPIGQRLWVPALATGAVRVIGVVGHVRHWGLAGDDSADVRDQIYYPFAQVPDSLMTLYSRIMSLAVHSANPSPNLVESIRSALHGDPLLYDTASMEQAAADSLARQRFLLALFGAFSSLALLLACIGIYGVLSYLTRQRVPEIGVRMALGASSGEILRMVIRQSLAMVMTGIAVGMAGAIEAARLLQKLVQGVGATSPSTYAAMLTLLAAAALFASFIPARRASRIDPVEALRCS